MTESEEHAMRHHLVVMSVCAAILISLHRPPAGSVALDRAFRASTTEPCLSIRVDFCGDTGHRACELARTVDRTLAELLRVEVPIYTVEAVAPDLVIVALPGFGDSVERVRSAIRAIGFEPEPFADDADRIQP